MSDHPDDQPPVFGDRNRKEPIAPFGSRGRQPDQGAGQPLDPNTPYAPRPRLRPPVQWSSEHPVLPPAEQEKTDTDPSTAPAGREISHDSFFGGRPRREAQRRPQAVPPRARPEPPPPAPSEAIDIGETPIPPALSQALSDEPIPAATPSTRRPRRADAPPPRKPRKVTAGQTGARPATLRADIALRSVGVIASMGVLLATIFTWGTPNSFLTTESLDQLSVAQATQSSLAFVPTAIPPTPTTPPRLNRVGLVSGHKGIYPSSGLPDPGAVCPDGLTEASINESVTMQVADLIRGHGYEVDVLEEFDIRLTGYEALALVSIHSDTCLDLGPTFTGFKVASFESSQSPEEDTELVSCLINRYTDTTGLPFHPSITYDMTQYHNFREINPMTPGAIIELGFMYMDRDILTTQSDVVALGVARGILCYLRGENPFSSTATPSPAGN